MTGYNPVGNEENMDFDVRKKDNDIIERVYFSDTAYISDGGNDLLDIGGDEHGNTFWIRVSEVDDMIKALKKAKEAFA